MNPNDKKIWFPAKRYGWGWGPPTCWQGWAVIMIWIAGLILGSFALRPDKHPGAFVAFMAVMITALMGVCFVKGEKPGWRWGDK